MTQESSLVLGRASSVTWYLTFLTWECQEALSTTQNYTTHYLPGRGEGGRIIMGGLLSAYTSSHFWGVEGGAAAWKPNQPFFSSGFKGHRVDIVILSEASETEKDKHHMILLMIGILKNKTNELIYKTEIDL